jgi:hypothetical protein
MAPIEPVYNAISATERLPAHEVECRPGHVGKEQAVRVGVAFLLSTFGRRQKVRVTGVT